jgi:hypothetical protein
VALVVCSVLYLVWWWAFFRPEGAKPTGAWRAVAIACIVVAALAGVIGVIQVVGGTGELGDVSAGASAGVHVPGWAIASGGVLAYAALLALTTKAFGRQPTTELFLIVGWATLELTMINALSASGASQAAVVVLLVLVALLFVASMVCYVLYYRLDPWPAFVDGCVPLVAVGVFSAVTAVMLA